jgi:anti-sigma regulatory factor (Ser/Thr protein kinase)
MKRTRSFEHSPEAVSAARRFASELLQGVPTEALETIALMVSELASNCVRHTDSGFELTVSKTARDIRVAVTDSGSGQPRVRTPAPTDPDGRGLQIVDMLSSGWGVEKVSGAGKTVWFTVGLQSPVATASA